MSDGALSRKGFLGGAALAVGAGFGALANPPAVAATEPPRLPMTILTRGLPAESVAKIEAISPQIKLVRASGSDDWNRVLPDADVIFGSVSSDDLRLAKKLRWIQWGAAGVEGIVGELVDRPVLLTNAKGCYGPEIAEHVFGLLFALTRGVAQQVRQMREHKWGGVGGYVELRGLTMGIVGFGGIGRETARRARAMDMRVVAVDAEPFYREKLPLADEIHLVDDWLPELLRQSDVVVVAAPHTRRTEGLLGEREFALMKPAAYLINVARGKIVQTPALVAALTNKKIAGAGLDVTDPEPLPPDHALWDLPNVVLTAHIAGQSQLAQARVQDVFVENVRRWARGLPLLNLVDKQAGY